MADQVISPTSKHQSDPGGRTISFTQAASSSISPTSYPCSSTASSPCPQSPHLQYTAPSSIIHRVTLDVTPNGLEEIMDAYASCSSKLRTHYILNLFLPCIVSPTKYCILEKLTFCINQKVYICSSCNSNSFHACVLLEFIFKMIIFTTISTTVHRPVELRSVFSPIICFFCVDAVVTKCN